MSLIIKVETEDTPCGPVYVLSLDGRLVAGKNVSGFTAAIEALSAPENEWPPQIILDLKKVTYIDSEGMIAGLAQGAFAVSRAQGQLKLLNPTEQIATLLKDVKLDGIFPSYTDRADAIASYAAKKPEPKIDNLYKLLGVQLSVK